MAFIDNFNKALEKAGQGLNTAAQEISDTAKEIGDNISKAINDSNDKTEKITKCPKCGQPLNGITAVCPSCGYELRTSSSSVAELAKEINGLERRRHDVLDSLSSAFSGSRVNPTDRKIASTINNYIVPNTKEDIFEFMVLAAGNMDADILAGKHSASAMPKIIVNAWASKFEQTYRKAKISFGSDSDFGKIQEIYNQKMDEIEDAKHFFKRRKS